MGTRFSAPVQTGPGAHLASCTMGTGSFPGVQSGRSVRLTPHSLLLQWSRKSRAIPLLPLWAVRPVQSLSACTSVHFALPYLHITVHTAKKIVWSITLLTHIIRKYGILNLPTRTARLSVTFMLRSNGFCSPLPPVSVPLSSSSSSSSVICQTTGPKPLPKRFLHTVRSRASSFN